MARHRVRGAAWFVVTAVAVFVALVAIAVIATMANGEGVACRDAECGAVSNLLDGPVGLISFIAFAAVAGALMASCKTRR